MGVSGCNTVKHIYLMLFQADVVACTDKFRKRTGSGRSS